MEYDVVVSGGGIAGSVAARFAAQAGFRTLLLEKRKTPRVKPCSGIQWGYFERLIGARVPPDKLCRNALSRVEVVNPAGHSVRPPIPIRTLNFWRATFDHWLNGLAAQAGADFQDETTLLDFAETERGVDLRIGTKGGEHQVRARYLVAADGAFSRVRRKLRPQDFGARASGGAVNYYFVGSGALDPHTLYMVWNRDFAPLMFAWIYRKDDLWVIGTGAGDDPVSYAERFFRFVEEKYGLQGEIVRRERFSSALKEGVYLGQGHVLLAGDAAGLIDLYRGLGMDNAALSGRLLVRALCQAEESGRPALEHYRQRLQPLVRTIAANARKQAARFASNQTLGAEVALAGLIRGGLQMLPALVWNRFVPVDRIALLPV